jgi:hypothetical protein
MYRKVNKCWRLARGRIRCDTPPKKNILVLDDDGRCTQEHVSGQDRHARYGTTVLRSTVDGSTERWRFLVGVGLDWIRFRRSLRRRRRGKQK